MPLLTPVTSAEGAGCSGFTELSTGANSGARVGEARAGHDQRGGASHFPRFHGIGRELSSGEVGEQADNRTVLLKVRAILPVSR